MNTQAEPTEEAALTSAVWLVVASAIVLLVAGTTPFLDFLITVAVAVPLLLARATLAELKRLVLDLALIRQPKE
jgi:hypothetical protein